MTADPQAMALLDQITQLSEAYKTGQPGARESLLGTCSRLQSRLMLPAETMLLHNWAQPTLQTITKLGMEIQLFEALASENAVPKTSTTLATLTTPPAEPVLISRLLRHLAAMGTITETAPDTFAPTRLSLAYIKPQYRDFATFIFDDFRPVHPNAPAYFAQNGYKSPQGSGDCPFTYALGCPGESMFDFFARKPAMGKHFAGMMDVWSTDRPKWQDAGYYPVRERLVDGAKKDDVFVVDVGGGTGHDLQQLRDSFGEQLPGKLVLQDRPEILEHAAVAPEIERRSHDFLTEQPVKGARAYYLHSIIQDWNDATCEQILRALVPALERGYSKILINDYVVPDEGAHWGQTALDFELMVCLGARHRTAAEHRKVVESAGLRVVGIWSHELSLDSLIEVELA